MCFTFLKPAARASESELVGKGLWRLNCNKGETRATHRSQTRRAPCLCITACVGTGFLMVFPLGTCLMEEEYNFGKTEE